MIGFVCLEAMERQLVLLREDGDGTNAELGRGSKYPDSDFGAIGYQQLGDWPV